MKMDDNYFDAVLEKLNSCVVVTKCYKTFIRTAAHEILKQLARDAAEQQREMCSNNCMDPACSHCPAKLEIK